MGKQMDNHNGRYLTTTLKAMLRTSPIWAADAFRKMELWFGPSIAADYSKRSNRKRFRDECAGDAQVPCISNLQKVHEAARVQNEMCCPFCSAATFAFQKQQPRQITKLLGKLLRLDPSVYSSALARISKFDRPDSAIAFDANVRRATARRAPPFRTTIMGHSAGP